MDGIREYIKSIGYYIVFSSAVKMLVPNKKMREYVNMVLGLIFMVIVLNPISELINTGLPRLEDYIIKSGSELGKSAFNNSEYKQNEDIINNEYKEICENRIKDICNMYFEECDVEISFSKERGVEKIIIYGKEIGKEQECREILKATYGIEDDCIIIYGEER